MGNIINVITDEDGKKIVKIKCVRFKGKRNVDWEDVRRYLNEFVGENYTIASSGDAVYLGKDLPDEYTGSKDTYRLRGALAKAKANAAQGLGEMIECATDGEHTSNRKEKHYIDAANGWYKYTTRFALPAYGKDGDVERYNVFRAFLIIRHDQDGKKYLYDVIKIKKETSNPPSC